MFKNFFISITIILIAFSLISCNTSVTPYDNTEAENTKDKTSTDSVTTQVDTEKRDTFSNVQSETTNVEYNTETYFLDNVPKETNNVPEETNDANAYGGNDVCSVHEGKYHSFPGRLIELIDEDTFYEWAYQYGSTATPVPTDTDCKYPAANIYNFVHEFNIPKETFIEYYNSFPYYNIYYIDLIYGDDPEAVDQFYRNLTDEFESSIDKTQNFLLMKTRLIYQNQSLFTDDQKSRNTSMFEILRITNRTSEDVLVAVNNDIERHGKKIDGITVEGSRPHYAYDYASYNSKTTAEIDALIAEHSVFYLDCLFCGLTPYETPYEQQCVEYAKELQRQQANAASEK